MSKYREVLQGAKNKVEKGWIKHRMEAKDGSLCALQALLKTAQEDRYYGGAGYDAIQILKTNLPDKFKMNSITYFNDHPDTTKEDILALFDRAIAWEPRKPIDNPQ